MQRSIPVFEPEVIASAEKKAGPIGAERVPTTSLRSLVVEGVELSSRYDKAHEYETMSGMVRTLTPDLIEHVASIFCDSKATASYTVRLRECSVAKANAIARQFEEGCIICDGGHNGIWLSGSAGGEIHIPPNWLPSPLQSGS